MAVSYQLIAKKSNFLLNCAMAATGGGVPLDLPLDENSALREKVLTQKAELLLRSVAKKYLAVCQEVDGGDSSTIKKAKDSFARELHMFEFEVEKTKRVRRANTRELETYEKKQQQVEQRIKQTTEDISRLRGELELARIERNHKEEYDLLARKILELPSRQESLAAAKALDGEIAELETEAQRLESTIDLRSKQFALVMHLISNLGHQTLPAEDAADDKASPRASGSPTLKRKPADSAESDRTSKKEKH